MQKNTDGQEKSTDPAFRAGNDAYESVANS